MPLPLGFCSALLHSTIQVLPNRFDAFGSTAGTAAALNSQLGKHFILAQADETFIKLTNLESVESIQKSLDGYDAVIVGDSMAVQSRPVTAGTLKLTEPQNI